MKIKLLLFTIAVSIAGIVCGQKQNHNSGHETLILQLENDWAKALVNRDETVFDKLLAADFFYTENDKLYTRSEVIQSVMSVSDTIVSAYNEDMQVHLKDKT